MNRLLPQPLMSLALLLTWLLANNTIAPGAIVLGAVLATVIPLWTARFWPEYPQQVRYGRAARLTAILLWDILVANIRVAVLILGPRSRLHPRLFVLPLDLKHPFAITLLASMITLTPGTVSANLSGDRRQLLVHGLNVRDPDQTVAEIKQRYERALMEIFE